MVLPLVGDVGHDPEEVVVQELHGDVLKEPAEPSVAPSVRSPVVAGCVDSILEVVLVDSVPNPRETDPGKNDGAGYGGAEAKGELLVVEEGLRGKVWVSLCYGKAKEMV